MRALTLRSLRPPWSTLYAPHRPHTAPRQQRPFGCPQFCLGHQSAAPHRHGSIGRPIRMEAAAIEKALITVPDWYKLARWYICEHYPRGSTLEFKDKDAIQRRFVFNDFAQAWAFMTGVARFAEELDHHPLWINQYNTVECVLETHDCNGLSDLDFRMASKMNDLAAIILNKKK